MFTDNTETGYDPYFPTSYLGKNEPSDPELDVCLGSSALSDAYHYYGFSPCIFENKLKSNAETCSSTNGCKDQLLQTYVEASV